jgi:membrane-bound lytic murein transglycosylase B
VFGVIPSVRRLRGLVPPGWRGAVAGALAVTLPLAALAMAAADDSGAAAARSAPTPSPTAGLLTLTPADVAASLGDLRSLRSFDKVAKKPQAAAPIRKLPKVDLLKVDVGGIPPVAAGAYVKAARSLAASDPSCGLKWWLVAGIGYVESGHAASGGSGSPGWDGVARPPILGPVLDGSGGYAAIRDSDNGAYDGDRRWDRAVGPMQFLPQTWRTWGAVRSGAAPGNPQNIVAAAHATARYLCASGGDLSTPHGMALAVFSYNHSFDYIRLVMSVGARYAGIDPSTLGVNQLPTDKQYRKHKKHERAKKARHARKHRKATRPKPSASSSPKPASHPSASPSPSPSSTGSGGGGGGPLPQPSATPTLPLPSKGPGLP